MDKSWRGGLNEQMSSTPHERESWGAPRQRASSDDMPEHMPEQLKQLLTGKEPDGSASFPAQSYDPNWE